MSTAAPAEQPEPDPASHRIRRAVTTIRRRAWITGLALWAAGAALLGAHATGAAFPDPTRFAMTDSWVIGLACIGCPMLPMRALARRSNPEIFRAVGACCFTLALFLTALILSGAMRVNTLDATFELILPLAAGIHAVNAWDAEAHAKQRERASYQAAREDAAAMQIDNRYAVLAGLDDLEAMTIGELTTVVEIATGIIAHKRSDELLHLVPAPSRPANGARRNRV